MSAGAVVSALQEQLASMARDLEFDIRTEVGPTLYAVTISAPAGKVWASTRTTDYSASGADASPEEMSEVNLALIGHVHESIGASHDRSGFALPPGPADGPIAGGRVKQLLAMLTRFALAHGYTMEEYLAVNLAMTETRFIQLLSLDPPETVAEDLMMVAGCLQVEFNRVVHRLPMSEPIDPDTVTTHILKAIEHVRTTNGRKS